MKTLLWFAGTLAGLALAGCAPEPAGSWQGYVEGEFVYVASPLGGALTNLAVSRGAEVKAGQVLFELEHEAEAAALRQAGDQLAQSKARLADLRKGRRPTEIASLEAGLDRARANLRLSELELERRGKLIEGKVISPEELDSVRSRRDADTAQVKGLEADLATARLGAREDALQAAEAEVQSFQSALTKATWAVTQKVQSAPASGMVQDTLYRAGEFVAAGNPVVSLLPLENVKVRFFVPQTQLAALKPGTSVAVSFDGATGSLRGTVNYISAQAEFTPPVIYSKENRAKLVFMVEAAFAPADGKNLRPGQPVDVKLAP